MTTVPASIIPATEPQRMAAVQRYEILDTPPDGAFDRITALAARLFNVPIAIVSIVDHDRIWFKSHHGLQVEQIDRAPGLCASAILHDAPWVINDAPADPRALSNPLVAGEFGLKFYAGVPLHTSDGHNLGTICVIDYEPREFTAIETTTLEDLSAMVVSELELRLATKRAVEQAEERELLKDAFIGMLSHELRTPITTIYAASHILENSATIQADPRASDLFADVTAESERLLRLTEDLLVLTQLERGSLSPTRIRSSSSACWPARSRRRPGAGRTGRSRPTSSPTCHRRPATRCMSSRSSATSCRTRSSTAIRAPRWI